MLLTQNDAERAHTNTDVWHRAGYTGKGVHIVIFDERGTLHEHMSYADTPLWNPKDYEASHGTNVVQVAHQFAPDARITFLVSGMAAREWFKANAHDVDVVNISRSAIRQLAEHSYGFLEEYSHIPVFCSSGNDSKNAVVYPARFDWTIAVGAYEDDHDRLALYSNGGERLDCVGFTDIYIPNSEGRPFRYNGTSTSSPQVAGSIACYIQYLKENGIEYDREDIRQFIHENAIDIEEEGFDKASGHGLFCLPENVSEIAEIDPIEKEVVDKVTEMFKDVANSHWAHGTIKQGKERGIVGGYPDGTFRPDEPITRAEVTAIANRAIDYAVKQAKK